MKKRDHHGSFMPLIPAQANKRRFPPGCPVLVVVEDTSTSSSPWKDGGPNRVVHAATVVQVGIQLPSSSSSSKSCPEKDHVLYQVQLLMEKDHLQGDAVVANDSPGGPSSSSVTLVVTEQELQFAPHTPIWFQHYHEEMGDLLSEDEDEGTDGSDKKQQPPQRSPAVVLGAEYYPISDEIAEAVTDDDSSTFYAMSTATTLYSIQIEQHRNHAAKTTILHGILPQQLSFRFEVPGNVKCDEEEKANAAKKAAAAATPELETKARSSQQQKLEEQQLMMVNRICDGRPKETGRRRRLHDESSEATEPTTNRSAWNEETTSNKNPNSYINLLQSNRHLKNHNDHAHGATNGSHDHTDWKKQSPIATAKRPPPLPQLAGHSMNEKLQQRPPPPPPPPRSLLRGQQPTKEQHQNGVAATSSATTRSPERQSQRGPKLTKEQQQYVAATRTNRKPRPAPHRWGTMGNRYTGSSSRPPSRPTANHSSPNGRQQQQQHGNHDHNTHHHNQHHHHNRGVSSSSSSSFHGSNDRKRPYRSNELQQQQQQQYRTPPPRHNNGRQNHHPHYQNHHHPHHYDSRKRGRHG